MTARRRRDGGRAGPVIAALAGLAVVGLGIVVGLVAVATLASRGVVGINVVGSTLYKPIGAVASAVVGAIIVVRARPNPVGRVMVLIGLLLAIDYPAEAYVEWDGAEPGRPGAAVAAWLADTIPIVVLTIVVPRLLVLFPDGRLPSPRWRAWRAPTSPWPR